MNEKLEFSEDCTLDEIQHVLLTVFAKSLENSTSITKTSEKLDSSIQDFQCTHKDTEDEILRLKKSLKKQSDALSDLKDSLRLLIQKYTWCTLQLKSRPKDSAKHANETLASRTPTVTSLSKTEEHSKPEPTLEQSPEKDIANPILKRPCSIDTDISNDQSIYSISSIPSSGGHRRVGSQGPIDLTTFSTSIELLDALIEDEVPDKNDFAPEPESSPRTINSLSENKEISSFNDAQIVSFDDHVSFAPNSKKVNTKQRSETETRVMVEVKPQELVYDVKFGKPVHISSWVVVKNLEAEYCAFKMMTNCPKFHIVSPRFGYISPHSEEKVRVILARNDGFPEGPCKIRLLVRISVATKKQTEVVPIAEFWKKGLSFDEYKIKCRWKQLTLSGGNAVNFGSVINDLCQMQFVDLVCTGPSTRLVDLIAVVCRVISEIPCWQLDLRKEIVNALEIRMSQNPCLAQIMSSFLQNDIMKRGLLAKGFETDGFLFFRQIRQTIMNRLIEYDQPIEIPKNLKVWNPFQIHEFPPIKSLTFDNEESGKNLCTLLHEGGEKSRLVLSLSAKEQTCFEPLLQLFNMIWFEEGLEYGSYPISAHWVPVLPLCRDLFCMEHKGMVESTHRFLSTSTNHAKMLASLIGCTVACYALGIAGTESQMSLTREGLITSKFSELFSNHRFSLPHDLLMHTKKKASRTLDLCVVAMMTLRKKRKRIVELSLLLLTPFHQEYEIKKALDRIFHCEATNEQAMTLYQQAIFNSVPKAIKDSL